MQEASETDRANRSEPMADLGGISLIHVEEVRHHRLHHRLAGVIRRHRYEATENLRFRCASSVICHAALPAYCQETMPSNSQTETPTELDRVALKIMTGACSITVDHAKCAAQMRLEVVSEKR